MNPKRKDGYEYRSFNLQLPVEMFDEAKRRAAEQGISMQKFIRMSVAGTTGVLDRSRGWTPPKD